jgi:hypothetical protein
VRGRGQQREREIGEGEVSREREGEVNRGREGERSRRERSAEREGERGEPRRRVRVTWWDIARSSSVIVSLSFSEHGHDSLLLLYHHSSGL